MPTQQFFTFIVMRTS